MTSRILPIVLILVAIGLFFGYINPTYTGSVAALRKEIRSYDAALVAAEAYAKKEAELLAQQSAIPEEGRARIEAFLPDSVDNVQLILDLDSLAARSGLELSDFNIKTSLDKEENGDEFTLGTEKPFESLEISVSAGGTYEAFKRFLVGTEYSLRPLDLVEVSVQDSPTGVYSYTMTFRIYWLATP
jgi:Tfp pilus assembly protein PilO